MTTQYTPYETQPPLPDPAPRRSNATKPLMILLAVIGGITLVVMLTTTIFSSVLGLSRGSATLAADTAGVTALDVNASAGQFTLEFAEVNEATLETSGVSADRWELTRHDTTLVVDTPSRWFSWDWFGANSGDNRVTLTLPEELNDGSLNAELDLGAGRLIATGDFDQLVVELNAGEARVEGSARGLDAQTNAGSMNLNLADVESSSFEVAAGRINAELTGAAPTATEIEVSAGRLDLTLPDETYAITSEVAAGNLDNRLNTANESQHQIAVELAAGNVRLRPLSNN
ncbi:hypothetical protein GCM10023190_14170 [Enteractinococcus fodinae]|uniref:DUF4097 domain-containing protein n=1 Tax=Enteractinococcus fodinae TaxID=684663 RepID=A0ABU2AXN1_9MICC|nr:DUF4097 family beta strand repeat-containing protein [Enteractinococcus fodinae]MDR7346107.1 hypothetical protein [Enteractinococcus fodinae]